MAEFLNDIPPERMADVESKFDPPKSGIVEAFSDRATDGEDMQQERLKSNEITDVLSAA